MSFTPLYATIAGVALLARSCVFSIMAVCICFLSGAPAMARSDSLVFWHSQTGLQSRFVQRLVDEFNARHPGGTRILCETGLELESILLSRIAPSIHPDLMLIPADMLGFRQELHLVPLPPPWEAIWKKTRITSKYGVPVLSGNQLYLFFNKRFVSQAPATWQELRALQPGLQKKGIKTIGWPYLDPYYFLPFLQAFGTFTPDRLDSPSMKTALHYYGDLAATGVVPRDCGFDCGTTRFLKGEFAFAISGDWAISEAKAKLKTDFGIGPLPSISGAQPLISGTEIQFLVFPKKTSFERHKELLKEFSSFLLSEPVQARWQKDADRVPVLPQYRPVLAGPSKPVPGDRSIVYAWTALRKGLQLLNDGETGIPGKMQRFLGELMRAEGSTAK